MDTMTSLPQLADELHDKVSDHLISASRAAGIRIVDASIRTCLSRETRLVSAVAQDLAEATAETARDKQYLGVFYIDGRVGGQLQGPGIYTVRVAPDGTDRIAIISDDSGADVARLAIKTTCDTRPAALVSGCCSVPDVGENFICVGFECCNPLTGCVSNEICLTT